MLHVSVPRGGIEEEKDIGHTLAREGMELDGALLWVVFLQSAAGRKLVTLGESLAGLALDLVDKSAMVGSICFWRGLGLCC